VANMDVVSDMAGTVWKIRASVGDQVEEGDIVLMIESMKMEIPLEAPSSGRVAEVLVEEGSSVADGQVVARIETTL